ncbi:MAG: RNA polymerase sigma factor [Thermoguttaceae bacterium]|nr:RNA polymerase sigma factor [Thermoguttaceae bacterium]MDW8039592.1 RNA polymerase sigma factor [Thermoguttaceae bacterium]
MQVPPEPASHEERFEGWVREHGRAVRGYLLAQLRRADLADELAQEVFLRAWQARNRYQDQGSLRAYLVRIADRLVCDLARRNGRDKTVSEQDWTVQQPAKADCDPVVAAMAQEAAQQVHRALDQLSPAQRRVLLLRYYGQMSFSEIAQTMEVPLNTVLSHCHRGLEKLRKILGEKLF